MSILSSLFKSRPGSTLMERRRQSRIRAKGDCFVRLEGRDVPLYDWSEFGFRAGIYKGALIAGQKAKAEFVLQSRYGKIDPLRMPVNIVVKRIDGWGISAQFTGLERYKLAALKKAYTAWSRAKA